MKGEMTRILRLSSDPTTYAHHISKLISNLSKKGYPKKILNSIASLYPHSNRHKALHSTTIKSKHYQDSIRLITSYHPSYPTKRTKHIMAGSNDWPFNSLVTYKRSANPSSAPPESSDPTAHCCRPPPTSVPRPSIHHAESWSSGLLLLFCLLATRGRQLNKPQLALERPSYLLHYCQLYIIKIFIISITQLLFACLFYDYFCNDYLYMYAFILFFFLVLISLYLYFFCTLSCNPSISTCFFHPITSFQHSLSLTIKCTHHSMPSCMPDEESVIDLKLRIYCF